MPGIFEISCGYHGDDGRLYINYNADRDVEQSLQIDDGGGYGVDVTVGIGLDLRTGKAFVTRNGRKLNTGTSPL